MHDCNDMRCLMKAKLCVRVNKFDLSIPNVVRYSILHIGKEKSNGFFRPV